MANSPSQRSAAGRARPGDARPDVDDHRARPPGREPWPPPGPTPRPGPDAPTRRYSPDNGSRARPGRAPSSRSPHCWSMPNRPARPSTCPSRPSCTPVPVLVDVTMDADQDRAQRAAHLHPGRRWQPGRRARDRRHPRIWPAAGISGLPVKLENAGPGHFLSYGLDIPLAGTWTLEVTVRTNAVDEYYANPVGHPHPLKPHPPRSCPSCFEKA